MKAVNAPLHVKAVKLVFIRCELISQVELLK